MFLACDGEDVPGGGRDTCHFGVCAIGGIAAGRPLLRDVDDAAGVHDVIGRVHDAAGLECFPRIVVEQLVVGGTAHDGAPQIDNGRAREHTSERARREHVAVRRHDLVRCEHGDTDAACLGIVDVPDRDVGAGVDEQAGEARAHVPGTLHDDAATRELAGTERRLARGSHAVQHPERGDRRGVARPAAGGIDTRHPRRLPRDAVHVALARADVFGCEIPPAEHVDPAAERSQERVTARRVGIVPEDDRLATTLGQVRHRGLHRHRLRQAQRVGACVLFTGVAPETDAAEGGAQHGGVDRHDSPQADRGIGERRHLLVLVVRVLVAEHGSQYATARWQASRCVGATTRRRSVPTSRCSVRR